MLKLRLVICLLFVTVFMGGCWDSQELENMNLPIIGGYDLHDEDPKAPNYMRVTSIIPVYSKEAKQKYYIDGFDGLTISDTHLKRTYREEKVYVPITVQGVVFNDRLARQGLKPMTDYIARNAQFKNSLPIGIVEGTAEELMHISVERNPNPGIFIRELLKTINSETFQVNPTLFQFSRQVYGNGFNPVLPLIKTYTSRDALLKGKDAEIIGSAIFKNDKMVGKVGFQESQILALLWGWPCAGKVTQVLPTEKGQVDKVTLLCTNKRKVKVRRVGEEYYFDVTILLNGSLVEHAVGFHPIDDKHLRLIESVFEKSLNQRADAFIIKMQTDLKVDCINITQHALAKWRHELKNQDFSELLKQYHIKVQVKVDIKDTGELY